MLLTILHTRETPSTLRSRLTSTWPRVSARCPPGSSACGWGTCSTTRTRPGADTRGLRGWGSTSLWSRQECDTGNLLWKTIKIPLLLVTLPFYRNSAIQEPSSSQEICLTNEFGKFRPRRCNFRFCAFCEKLEEVKPIFMKGFCEEMVQSFFDKEYFADGLRNKRIFFRFEQLPKHCLKACFYSGFST